MEFCWKLLFWQIFFKNFGCVFSRSNTILAISQEWLVRLMWNEKEVHRLDTGYNMCLTFDLTHDLDLGYFKVKFRNSSISGIVGLIDVKWKRGQSIWYWADYMTLPFGHSHDLDLGFGIARSESEIALSWMEWQIDMERKGCESSFHDHDIGECDHGGVGGCTG